MVRKINHEHEVIGFNVAANLSEDWPTSSQGELWGNTI